VGANTVYGSGGAAKTSSGDMYAGKDGNVYKNTGGSWQKYDNGSWNNVSKPTSASQPNMAKAQSSYQQTAAKAGGTSDLNQEFQNRQRGAAESQRFQSARSSGSFGGGSRSFSGGRRR
jgi:hypothetical protein